ncbi:GNAT family N-acetyltransferase [Falsiroseomonas sp.]|uniref:GNAT family N-acetyltransferase n=1 Tax=Falsiroseomonas sp. TaxID=2870721 RepID=UPI0035645B70
MAGAGSIVIRPAEPEDAAAIARILRASIRAAMPWLPELHTPEEDLAFIAGQVLPQAEVWVAGNPAPVGFVARRGEWLDHLYLAPSRRGEGIGRALLLQAMEGRERLTLWAFQRNHAARRFYERHGFRAVASTDGAGNEEKEPDVRYEWRRPA